MLWPGLGVNYHWNRNTWDEVERDFTHIQTFCKWIRPGIPDYRSSFNIPSNYINYVWRFCQMAQQHNLNLYWGLCQKPYFGPATWDAYVARQVEMCQFAQSRLHLDFYDAGNEEELKIDNNAVLSITRTGSTMTVSLTLDHEMRIGDQFMISGCSQPAYNGTWTVETMPDTRTVTTTILSTPVTPATGTPIFYSYTYQGLYNAIDAMLVQLQAVAHVPIAYSMSGHQIMRNLYRTNGLGHMDCLMVNQYDTLPNFYNQLKIDKQTHGNRVQVSEWGVSRWNRNGVQVLNYSQDQMYQQTKDRLQILKDLGYAIYMYYAYAESTEGFDLVEKDGTMNSQLQAMQGGRRTWITDDHQ